MAVEDKNIEKIVEDGLIKPTFDITQDIAELSIDSFLDNGILKEIPIVKMVVGLAKGGLAIREIFLAKKLLTFLKEYHSGNLSQEKKNSFIEKFKNDDKYRNSVVEQIMILNDRFISIEKSKVLANLFKAHINGKFDWEGFGELTQCLENLHTMAYNLLDRSANSDDPFHFSTYEVEKDGGGVMFSAGICVIHGNHYSINAHGQYLYYYGIKGDIDFEFPKQDGKS